MSTDPSWLYSTIAQSSAAIVAIIGGFITATVLSLMAEKRSLQNQSADKEKQLEQYIEQENDISRNYEEMKVEIFLDDNIDELLEQDELPSLEQLMINHPGQKLDNDILNNKYKELSKDKLEAKRFIEQKSNMITPENSLNDFDKWFKNNRLDISNFNYEILRKEYERQYEVKKEILEEEKRKSHNNLFDLFNICNSQDWIYSLKPPVYSAYEATKNDNALEYMKRKLQELRQHIAFIKTEIDALGSRLKTFSYPPNLKWGIATLGYLAFFGIIIPVIIIGNELYDSDPLKWLTMVSFLVGIILVFFYVSFLIWTLRRK